ncbi:bifunctional pyr operon transcriptional regulator/uracil phosphoribosyltransferase PyrR [Puniceicoccaceae bacterium K14]|nr:bifunctional pyr operon transcriptional regulator/uracil phosphoribosyltransferase PyrR [Puniceicoccaceae bacterium K14]
MRTINSNEIDSAITSLAHQISETHSNTPNIVLAGIANGGIAFSNRLFTELKKSYKGQLSTGTIDISFHRDDVGQKPILKDIVPTHVLQDPEESLIILVDDVIFSGRSVRAAIAEIHTIGRPCKVELAVLVDRGNRRLPIAPDYSGFTIETTLEENVEVHIDLDRSTESKIEIK